jgi:Sortase domain
VRGADRRSLPQFAALAAVLLALATGLAVATGPRVAAPRPVTAMAAPTPSSPAAAAPVPASATRLRIPSIGVDAGFVPIDVDAAGVLVPPATTDVVGWFVRGPGPGQPGPAIAAGHIDSRLGPGVFFRLHEIAVGAAVEVGTYGGPPARYQVVSVTTLPKAEFPTAQVYGPTPAPELRLITCGGGFDRADRRYLSNVIVSAVLV